MLMEDLNSDMEELDLELDDLDLSRNITELRFNQQNLTRKMEDLKYNVDDLNLDMADLDLSGNITELKSNQQDLQEKMKDMKDLNINISKIRSSQQNLTSRINIMETNSIQQFNPAGYHLVEEKKTRDEANAFCREHKMTLAMIEKIEENRLLSQTFGHKAKLNQNGIWLGGIVDAVNNSKCRWGEDGTQWKCTRAGGAFISQLYRNWAAGEP